MHGRTTRNPSRAGSTWTFAACTILCLLATGCANGPGSSGADRLGRTYYIDGAGNWGYGVFEIQNGLKRAGYQGNVINYRWSPTFNPALDQTVGRPIARLKGAALGQEITKYLQKYPRNQVNIIALSAGTGVAVWACENIDSPVKVRSLILLGSSLSSTYDMRKALRNIAGGVYVYYSRSDMILQGPVRTLGTIDGKIGIASAGLVGLRSPSGGGGKIYNIGWSSKYERYGWTGSHTDATSEPFVQRILARHIISRDDRDKNKARRSRERAKAVSCRSAQASR